jgi:septum site-determining protein MinC
VIIRNNPAMVIDTPVRAGQHIYTRGADLIIAASVNNGAEVIADGSIHIYSTLRGRVAGATGNTEARILHCKWNRNWCRLPVSTGRLKMVPGFADNTRQSKTDW